jgi:hypothetical protein
MSLMSSVSGNCSRHSKRNNREPHEILSETTYLFIYHSFHVISVLILTSKHVTYLERFRGTAQEQLPQ